MCDSVIPANVFYSQSKFKPPALVPGAGSRAALAAAYNAHFFRVFPLQQAAIDACDSNPHLRLRLWSFEINNKGKRKYAAASYADFWRYYKKLLRRDIPLHFYEVIREKHACKLYFDLEYFFEFNKDKDAERMIDILVATCGELAEVPVNRSDGSIIELDSTKNTKFSRHLIFQNIAFFDNIQTGDFANRVVETIMSRDSSAITVQGKSGQLSSFVDLAVYTRNRCFRLLASSKFGKIERLLPSGQRHISFSHEFFQRSLVCTVTKKTTLLGTPTPMPRRPSLRMRNTSNNVNNSDGSFVRLPRNSSNYPEIDEHIYSIIRPCGGDIHAITLVSDSYIIYAIKGSYKYCHNIGRHHKSNNVMLVVDLNTRMMRQKCFDPDCRGFQSFPWPIPQTAFANSPNTDAGVNEDTALCEMMDHLEEMGYEASEPLHDDVLIEMMDRVLSETESKEI